MNVYKFVVGLIVFLPLIFASTTFAGGGLVSFDIPWEGRALNPGEQYVVRPTVKQDDGNFCRNCPIKIKLENPDPSDVVNQSSDKTDENGSMYAKVVSNIMGNRVVYAEVTMPDGSIYTSSKAILNYSSEVLPILTPNPISQPITGPIVVTIASQNKVSGLKGSAREVTLEWNKPFGADYFNIYLRPSDYEFWGTPLEGTTRNTKTKVLISADYDYLFKIDGCNENECKSSNELYVPKMSAQTQISASPNPSAQPLLGDKKIDDLEEKVAKLESEVENTKKKQSLLETKFNGLLSWLKSFFSFNK